MHTPRRGRGVEIETQMQGRGDISYNRVPESPWIAVGDALLDVTDMTYMVVKPESIDVYIAEGRPVYGPESELPPRAASVGKRSVTFTGARTAVKLVAGDVLRALSAEQLKMMPEPERSRYAENGVLDPRHRGVATPFPPFALGIRYHPSVIIVNVQNMTDIATEVNVPLPGLCTVFCYFGPHDGLEFVYENARMLGFLERLRSVNACACHTVV